MPSVSLASSLPVPNLEVTAKKLPIGKVLVVNSETDGYFIFNDIEIGQYELFLYGEVISLGKYNTQNGKISGKVLINIDENTDPFTEKNWNANHLKRLGYILHLQNILPPDITLTEVTSPKIKNYIKKFQAKYNIRQTGNLGPSTILKLNEIFKDTPN